MTSLSRNQLPELNVLAALNCEVKAVVDLLKLKKSGDRPFAVYEGVAEIHGVEIRICVVVTGIGAVNMATAVGWLGAKNGSAVNVWLNIGIAGHSHFPVGEAFVVTSSRDVFSPRTYYPPQVAKRTTHSCGCLSLNAPSSDYPEVGGLDMEAASFYKAACHFTVAECVQSFKVVSDNPGTDLESLSASVITKLMAQHTRSILDFAYALTELCIEVPSVKLGLSLPRCRATHSQKQQFESMSVKVSHTLSELQIRELEDRLGEIVDFKSALSLLEQALSHFTPTLEGD